MTLVLRTARDWRVVVLLLVTLIALVSGIVYASGSSDAVPAQTASGTCATPRPLTPGLTHHDLEFAGGTRTFDVYVPASYDGARRTRVVFLFHGYGGTPAKVLRTSAMEGLAEEKGFIVVAPQAAGEHPTWDFRTPGDVPDSDVAFARALVDRVREGACVDPDGIFAAGFSNGSAFSLALACDDRSPFAAYGAVSGPYIAPDCSRARPATIAYFHGLVDPVVPYGGASTVIGPLPGVDDTIAQWVAHDRCPSRGARTAVEGPVRHFSWRDCADGSAISVYTLRDAGHAWPAQVVGRDDASRLMWSFFTRAEQTAHRG